MFIEPICAKECANWPWRGAVKTDGIGEGAGMALGCAEGAADECGTKFAGWYSSSRATSTCSTNSDPQAAQLPCSLREHSRAHTWHQNIVLLTHSGKKNKKNVF